MGCSPEGWQHGYPNIPVTAVIAVTRRAEPPISAFFKGQRQEQGRPDLTFIAVITVTRLSCKGNLPPLLLSAVLIADTVFT